MELSPAQLAALMFSKPAEDGRYHLTQESGVTVSTVRVLLRRQVVALVSWTDRPDRASRTQPSADWEVTLTKTGLQHRDVWRRVLWQAADQVPVDETGVAPLTAEDASELRELLVTQVG